MVARKKRTPVVIDTNVFVRSFKTRTNTNPNRRVVRLWLLEKQLQLIVSSELIDEYLDIFAEILGMDDETIAAWRVRFEEDGRSTLVNLARRYTASRDPDDNLLLATASAGAADCLLTNDLDLLELPVAFQRTLPFAIMTPRAFLQAREDD
jgi:putative PIN family toxin of toxin-antitoxin system